MIDRGGRTQLFWISHGADDRRFAAVSAGETRHD
jgi:hypothetical protein